MAADLSNPKHDMGQLLGMVLTMIQERIGIVIGGILFLTFVPLLALIPSIFSFISLCSIPKDQLDFARILPSLMVIGTCCLFYIPIYYSLKVGWLSICLKITKSEPAPFSEFFANFGLLPNFLLMIILGGLAIGVGMCFLIIPGIFLAVKFCFAPYLVIDQKMGAMEALSESWGMVTGCAWKILLAYLCFAVANLLVSFIPIIGFVGQLFAMAYIDLLITTLYRDKKGDLVAEAQ